MKLAFLRINNFRNKTKTLMNIGTIIDNSTIKVKLKNEKILGFVDDFFILSIKCGDTFTFSGLNLLCNLINSDEIIVEIVNKKSLKTQFIGEVTYC